jgi:hypothetical protein
MSLFNFKTNIMNKKLIYTLLKIVRNNNDCLQYITAVNGLRRVIDYDPIYRKYVYDVNNFSFSIRPRDTLLAITVNNGVIQNKQNKPVNAIGKMMVINSITEIKLDNLLLNFGHMSIHSTVIFSINLREDIKEEIFQIKNAGITVTYVEIGINYFI